MRRQLIEILHNFIRFRFFYHVTFGVMIRARSAGLAFMQLNSRQQISGAAIVHKPDSFSQPPQWRGAELIRSGLTLANAIGEFSPHIMYQQIGIQKYIFIA